MNPAAPEYRESNVDARTSPGRFRAVFRGALLAATALTVVAGLLALTGILQQMRRQLAGWGELDNWIVVTAVVVAMACALPGNFLLLRRQSMMGDALSHTVLPGIMIAFLLAHVLRASGWLGSDSYILMRHGVMLAGAVGIGVLCAVLTQWVERAGQVESSAALGVVFTTLFAIGLLLMRLAADEVHIDPNCVFYGTIETIVFDTYGDTGVPVAVLVNGLILALNLVLLLLFYKELKISAFDPQLATTLGINSQGMLYGLMAVTAATLVAAFESVGSILVIAMLIVPPATASLLTERLARMIFLSLVIAAGSAVLGHVLAITLPAILFSPIGYPEVTDASTAGMMAFAAGLLFVLAMLFGPRQGLFSRAWDQLQLSLRIASDDLLGLLYRIEERNLPASGEAAIEIIQRQGTISRPLRQLALLRLRRRRQVTGDGEGLRLTDRGRHAARHVVRSHRLWESYLAEHFDLPEDHLHSAAQRVTSYIDPAISDQLAQELRFPTADPHGSRIPAENGQKEPPSRPADDLASEDSDGDR